MPATAGCHPMRRARTTHQMPFLLDFLHRAADRLPGAWRATHARLLEEEHLDRMSARFESFLSDGVPDEQPKPHFSVECTPPMADAFAPLQPVLTAWQEWGAADGRSDDDAPPDDLQQQLADALSGMDFGHVLVLLGQRQTPASLKDERGIPPLHATLMAAANTPFSDSDKLTVCARAWSKHSGRSDDNFWGEVRGSVADKNAAADRLVRQILDSTTWWNVFGHFQHETVFEARCPTGHGVRWGHDGTTFIGFLEPFDDSESF